MASELEYMKKILKLLKVPIGKLSLNKNNTIVQTSGAETIVGFASIVLSALRQTNTLYKYENSLEYLEIEEWLDYTTTTLKNLQNSTLNRSILSELDQVLRTRTYIVNTRPTIGDIALYYSLINVMKSLNPHEKAQYLNVSRWFDNIQQDISIRQDLQLINFNTNYLLSTVVVSH